MIQTTGAWELENGEVVLFADGDVRMGCILPRRQGGG